MSGYDFENSTWKYDIETYERAKLIVGKIRAMNNTNNLDYWLTRANAIVDKYPAAKLERVV